jgi:hypothetical protein
MSGDYRPRSGGGESSGGRSGSGPGGRRRRGGRGRSRTGAPHSGPGGESRAHANGGAHSAPKKKEGPITKLIGWLTGKNKKKPQDKAPVRTPSPRSEVREREPRADRPERSPRAERPPREERVAKADPTPQEITTPKLYVGNLAYEAAESDLFDLFSKVGAVKNVEVAMDRRANRSKGFGFVEMEELSSAKAAAEKLNRTDFMGRQIVVSGAKMERSSVNGPRDESAEAAPDSPAEPGSSTESTI